MKFVYDVVKAGYGRENSQLDACRLAAFCGKNYQTYLLGKYIIVNYRGTYTWEDILTDLVLLFGLHPWNPRFQVAKNIIVQLRQDHPEHIIVAMGHSLGGALAEHTSADYIITYNKGASPFAIGRTIPTHQLDIRVRGDCVSLITLLQFHPYSNLLQLSPNFFFSAHAPEQLRVA